MKKFILIIAVFFTFNMVLAQDIHFSQYNYSPLTLNPANTAAFNGDIRVCGNYKNQWNKVSPYRTYASSYDMSILKGTWKKGYLGIGLQFFNDRAGDAKMGLTQFNFSVSGIREISSNTNLSVGVQGGFAQRSVDFSALTWDAQYDGMAFNEGLSSCEAVSSASVNYSDYSAGVLWNYGKGDMYATANNAIRAHIGLAFFHINTPNQSFIGRTDRLNAKYVFHGGASIGLKNTNLSLCPDYMLLIQGTTKELTFGNAFKYNLQEASKYTGNIKGRAMYLGIHYRLADALILSYFLELDKYALGVSYDINISNLTTATSGMGGIEIALRFLNFTSTNTVRTGHSNTKFL